MLEKAICDVYEKFKLNFYQKIFSRFEELEAGLSTMEAFCIEVIHALKGPTISEFSEFIKISQANATYKVQSLIKKGYVEKIQSQADKREFRLVVTEKYYQYCNLSQSYIGELTKRISEYFPEKDIEELVDMLLIISSELMPDINFKKLNSSHDKLSR